MPIVSVLFFKLAPLSLPLLVKATANHLTEEPNSTMYLTNQTQVLNTQLQAGAGRHTAHSRHHRR